MSYLAVIQLNYTAKYTTGTKFMLNIQMLNIQFMLNIQINELLRKVPT